MKNRVLIVDKDKVIKHSLSTLLHHKGLANVVAPKLVCDVPDASGFGFIAIIYGCFSC